MRAGELVAVGARWREGDPQKEVVRVGVAQQSRKHAQCRSKPPHPLIDSRVQLRLIKRPKSRLEMTSPHCITERVEGGDRRRDGGGVKQPRGVVQVLPCLKPLVQRRVELRGDEELALLGRRVTVEVEKVIGPAPLIGVALAKSGQCEDSALSGSSGCSDTGRSSS